MHCNVIYTRFFIPKLQIYEQFYTIGETLYTVVAIMMS